MGEVHSRESSESSSEVLFCCGSSSSFDGVARTSIEESLLASDFRRLCFSLKSSAPISRLAPNSGRRRFECLVSFESAFAVSGARPSFSYVLVALAKSFAELTACARRPRSPYPNMVPPESRSKHEIGRRRVTKKIYRTFDCFILKFVTCYPSKQTV